MSFVIHAVYWDGWIRPGDGLSVGIRGLEAVTSHQNDRVLLFSQRGLRSELSRAASYEFEDVIAAVDEVSVLTAHRRAHSIMSEKIVNKLARRAPLLSAINPGVVSPSLTRDYDLFFALFQFPRDSISLNSLRGWRRRCRTAICWLEEFWIREICGMRAYSRILSQFDTIFTNCAGSVSALRKATGRPCIYLPPAVDAIRFVPPASAPPRVIDVLNIGRRSSVAHEALLAGCEKNGMFYLYDTLIKKGVRDPAAHRVLLANLAQRSKYFIANTAKFNRNQETEGQHEIGFRFFEGASAGAVMLGMAPDTEIFRQTFNWPDAVVPVDVDSTEIIEVVAELERDPARVHAARCNNLLNILRRHDWAHRWEQVLHRAGLSPKPPLVQRLERLEERANQIASAVAIPRAARVRTTS